VNFEESLKEGFAKKINVNVIRAKSLLNSSMQAIEGAKSLKLQETFLKSIFRELYEGLREYCEALGYIKGYRLITHESITHFLKDVLKENSISIQFDRYRTLRNGINYYGNDINLETVKEALKDIPLIITSLKKHEGNIK